MSIHGEDDKVELLQRATRLSLATLCNERLTFYGVPLFRAYARSELYFARLWGEDIVDAATFERRIQNLLSAGMQVGDLFSLDQCRQAAEPRWSFELNLLDCHLLLSSVVSLGGHILHMVCVSACASCVCGM